MEMRKLHFGQKFSVFLFRSLSLSVNSKTSSCFFTIFQLQEWRVKIHFKFCCAKEGEWKWTSVKQTIESGRKMTNELHRNVPRFPAKKLFRWIKQATRWKCTNNTHTVTHQTRENNNEKVTIWYSWRLWLFSLFAKKNHTPKQVFSFLVSTYSFKNGVFQFVSTSRKSNASNEPNQKQLRQTQRCQIHSAQCLCHILPSLVMNFLIFWIDDQR